MTPDAGKTQADIATEVAAYLERTYPNGAMKVSDDLRLLEEGVIDSLGLLELVAFIESQFGIYVDDHEVDLDNFGTVGNIATFVSTKVA
jgi:acyl carrier protein